MSKQPWDRVAGYVERFFQRSGCTDFPDVRRVARSLRIRQRDVESAVEDSGGLMQLTYWNVNWTVPLGDYFVETLEAP